MTSSTTNALAAAIVGSLILSGAPGASAANVEVNYRSTTIEGLSLSYREAGPRDAPVVLLLHGFPSSSHMFRNLIPILATKYRVIAPDYPGFGQSAQPALDKFSYSFAAMADVVDGLTEKVGAKSYAIYVQDYGGPVGFRLAMKHPERVKGFIVQNAVASADSWNPEMGPKMSAFWSNRNAQTEAFLRDVLKPEGTKFQYEHGATRSERLSPDAWVSDQAGLDRPGNTDVQLQMLFNYQDNFAQYSKWREYFTAKQPPMLIVWGKNDPFFAVKAIDYFKSVIASPEVHIYDAGHFALETHAGEIGQATLAFLDRLHRARR
jgi:pimeloyl-ACP methyl ester carboxylesterase